MYSKAAVIFSSNEGSIFATSARESAPSVLAAFTAEETAWTLTNKALTEFASSESIDLPTPIPSSKRPYSSI